MSIKYVEDYRSAGNDTKTIQAAIDNMKDGDTLVFNKCIGSTDIDGNTVYNKTYVLDEPVYLTSYNESTSIGKTRKYVTFDGNGCTITGSSDYIDTYGCTGENNKNAYFYLSDDSQNGLQFSTIKNFIFDWYDLNKLSSLSDYPSKSRSIALAVKTCYGSLYYSNSSIENCEFYNFGNGIYQCGDRSNVRGCYFESCYKGIYSDGSVHNVFEDNYFFTTSYIGIHMNVSFDSIVRNNSFYKCRNYSIFANGQYESSTDSKVMDVTITDNKIYGCYTDTRNDIGIKLHALHSFTVTDNYISGISRKSDIDGHGYGIGIWVSGNLDASLGICKSARGIISNNNVTNCYGEGIKIDIVIDCIVNGNFICNNTKYGESANKRGIVIRPDTHNVYVTNNTVSYYGENAIKNYSSNSCEVVNNITFNETSNLLRTVDGTTYTVPEISIPENIDNIENGEYFYLKIPDNYTESAVTIINYNGGSCMLCEAMPSDQSQYEGSIYTTIPTDKAGQYAVLKLFVENSNNKFILYGYAKL